jgi:hypothetical protein
MPVGCPRRGHRANSQSRSSPETDRRHHTSVRNPRSTLHGRASNRAPMSARAVAVIRPAPPSSLDSRSFASCLAKTASCMLRGTNVRRIRVECSASNMQYGENTLTIRCTPKNVRFCLWPGRREPDMTRPVIAPKNSYSKQAWAFTKNEIVSVFLWASFWGGLCRNPPAAVLRPCF